MKLKVNSWLKNFVTFLGKRGPLRFIDFMLLFTIFKTLENFLKILSYKVTRLHENSKLSVSYKVTR